MKCWTYQTYEDIAVGIMVPQRFQTDLIYIDIIGISADKTEDRTQWVYSPSSVSYKHLSFFINPYISTACIFFKWIYKVSDKKCKIGFFYA